jgi:hypothetical protein
MVCADFFRSVLSRAFRPRVGISNVRAPAPGVTHIVWGSNLGALSRPPADLFRSESRAAQWLSARAATLQSGYAEESAHCPRARSKNIN